MEGDIAGLYAMIFVGFFLVKSAFNTPSKVMRAVAIIGLLGLLAFWYYYYGPGANQTVFEADGDDRLPDDDDFLLDDDEEEMSKLQSDFTEKKNGLSISEGQATKTTTGTITYEYFKQICFSKDFINRFTLAILEALELKKKKIGEVMRTMNKEGRETPGGIPGMRENPLKPFRELSDIIQEKLRTTSPNTVRKNLYSALHDRKNGIESMEGRTEIKNFLASQLYTFSQEPSIFLNSFQNIALYGSAGIGKTKIGTVISHVYSKSGIVLRNTFEMITSQDILTAYVNESGPNMRRKLMKNLDGVIFIDEAYEFGVSKMKNMMGTTHHGAEALTEMVNYLDKMMGISVVIVAGYEDKMEEQFMGSNEGMPRRFRNIIRLQPFSVKELTKILIMNLKAKCRKKIVITSSNGNTMYTLLKQISEDIPLALKNQAGDIQNLSSEIAEALYGSPDLNWAQNADQIIVNGFNNFLSSKGYVLEQK